MPGLSLQTESHRSLRASRKFRYMNQASVTSDRHFTLCRWAGSVTVIVTMMAEPVTVYTHFWTPVP
jgi:hypothetical protein